VRSGPDIPARKLAPWPGAAAKDRSAAGAAGLAAGSAPARGVCCSRGERTLVGDEVGLIDPPVLHVATQGALDNQSEGAAVVDRVVDGLSRGGAGRCLLFVQAVDGGDSRGTQLLGQVVFELLYLGQPRLQLGGGQSVTQRPLQHGLIAQQLLHLLLGGGGGAAGTGRGGTSVGGLQAVQGADQVAGGDEVDGQLALDQALAEGHVVELLRAVTELGDEVGLQLPHDGVEFVDKDLV